MLAKIPKRPKLEPSGFMDETDPAALVIDYSFISGPERIQSRVSVTKDEYESIVSRILHDEALFDSIVNTWREYAVSLRKSGENAEPPLGSYHRRLNELCDPEDPERGAILATVFGERIESDVLLEYLRAHSPTWIDEFHFVQNKASRDG